jgi:hypothetical protein
VAKGAEALAEETRPAEIIKQIQGEIEDRVIGVADASHENGVESVASVA